jgi:hypothetical protein
MRTSICWMMLIKAGRSKRRGSIFSRNVSGPYLVLAKG